MADQVSGCGAERSSHSWVEIGDRLECRQCGLIDFAWSLSRRRMIEALRRAGSSTPDVR